MSTNSTDLPPRDALTSILKRGEKVPFKARVLTLTDLDLKSLPPLRAFLIDVATNHSTVSYGHVKSKLGLPHPANGMGRLLDLVTIECRRRGEPDLASLVVNASTGDVGTQYGKNAVANRESVYRHWSGG